MIRSGSRIRPIHLTLAIWNLLLLRNAVAENVHIVTPENSAIVTTDVPVPDKNKTKEWASNDSYVEAYQELRKGLVDSVKRNDHDFQEQSDASSQDDQSYNTVIRSSYLSENRYPSLTHHRNHHDASEHPSSSVHSHGPHRTRGSSSFASYAYGPPPSASQAYSAPSSTPLTYGPSSLPAISSLPDRGPPFLRVSHGYGPPPPPPTQSYGSPLPPPHGYGPPLPGMALHSLGYSEDIPTQMWHGMPYSSPSDNGFLPFLPKKLSLKLILKIVLKLILFKMIVKFIAVICLLLFIPTLKAKKEAADGDKDSEEKRKIRHLDLVSNFIWDSLESKNALYNEEEEMNDIQEIAEKADEESSYSGPESAVRFLEFCISTVDRVVGLILGYLKRERNEPDDLSSFFWKVLRNLVKSL